VKTLYLDLDGVLTDFSGRYQELFGKFPSDVREEKAHFWKNWKSWVEQRAFENLDFHEGAEELIAHARAMRDAGWKVEILSSSAGGETHDLVTEQKKTWLKKMGIDFMPNIVPGGSKKAEYARNNAILVDDTERVLNGFVKAGGIGILHTDAKNTISKLIDLQKELI
jgi:5' nucleotidase, deoxy (Pyrimidine), cytosolic type C protein (NT5C)